jgi:hypothetical protein
MSFAVQHVVVALSYEAWVDVGCGRSWAIKVGTKWALKPLTVESLLNTPDKHRHTQEGTIFKCSSLRTRIFTQALSMSVS